MLKEFAQYLVSLKDNKTYDIHGDTYSDHDLVRIKPHIDRPANLSVSGLDSIVKLVRNELDMFENLPVFIRVDDARTVSVFTTYDDVMCRDSLYTAKCDVPGFRDGFREYEQAIIELRSKFSPGPGVDYLLDLLSRMSKDSGVTTRDNGVSQEVEARRASLSRRWCRSSPAWPCAPSAPSWRWNSRRASSCCAWTMTATWACSRLTAGCGSRRPRPASRPTLRTSWPRRLRTAKSS